MYKTSAGNKYNAYLFGEPSTPLSDEEITNQYQFPHRNWSNFPPNIDKYKTAEALRTLVGKRRRVEIALWPDGVIAILVCPLSCVKPRKDHLIAAYHQARRATHYFELICNAQRIKKPWCDLWRWKYGRPTEVQEAVKNEQSAENETDRQEEYLFDIGAPFAILSRTDIVKYVRGQQHSVSDDTDHYFRPVLLSQIPDNAIRFRCLTIAQWPDGVFSYLTSYPGSVAPSETYLVDAYLKARFAKSSEDLYCSGNYGYDLWPDH